MALCPLYYKTLSPFYSPLSSLALCLSPLPTVCPLCLLFLRGGGVEIKESSKGKHVFFFSLFGERKQIPQNGPFHETAKQAKQPLLFCEVAKRTLAKTLDPSTC